MHIKTFINIAISDLQRSMAFYAAIGFTKNPMVTNESAAAMVFCEEIYVVLLTPKRFRDFIDKETAINSFMGLRKFNIEQLEEA
jgi:predicted lactoylglutathione lyase